MDETIILSKQSEIIDDIRHFYQKSLNNEFPVMNFGISVTKKDKETVEEITYNKNNVSFKKFVQLLSSNIEIENYEFYFNDKKVILDIRNLKNHIDFTNIKYHNFNLYFRNLSHSKMEMICLIKYFEDFIKHFFLKKVLKGKKYIFRESLIFQTEYIFNTLFTLDNKTKDITTPFYDETNNMINPCSIKKNDTINYLIELDKIWVNRKKKVFGINWIILQGLKNDDIYRNKCFINPHGITEVNKRNTNINSNADKVVKFIPKPPPINNIGEQKPTVKLNINLNELKKIKNKLTGTEIDN
jgi:hypothetical protein